MKRIYKFLFKIVAVITVLTFLVVIFSNVYMPKSMDKLAYVVALGIDVGHDNNLQISIQLAKPSSASGSSSSSSQSSSAIVESVECSNIDSGLNLLDSYISRDITLSHCKIIAISEAVANKGIFEYIYNLSSNLEVSPQSSIIITKCPAKEYLSMTKPVLENFPARYYNIVNTVDKTIGYTKADTLMQFFSDTVDTCKEPVTALANINDSDTHVNDITGSFANKDSSYIAGQTPIDSSNNIENMGLAVFKDGKMIGELNGLESICHLIVSGTLKYCNVQIKNPKISNDYINIRLKLHDKPKCNLTIINGNPYIDENIDLGVEILSINNVTLKYSDDVIESEINSYFKKIISNYLYKMSKEYNADIDGFGRYAIKYFTTKDKWSKYDWLDTFQNSFFKVNINSKVRANANISSS